MKLIIVFLLLLNLNAWCQSNTNCWSKGQTGNTVMELKKFDSLVTHYTRLLQQHKKMDTADYIIVIKLNNTIIFNRKGSSQKGCWPESNESYNKLLDAMSGRLFFDNLTKYLGLCIPNRGMGCYFQKYDLDYGGGGPNDNSMIQVKF